MMKQQLRKKADDEAASKKKIEDDEFNPLELCRKLAENKLKLSDINKRRRIIYDKLEKLLSYSKDNDLDNIMRILRNLLKKLIKSK